MIDPHLWLTQDRLIEAMKNENQEDVRRCLMAMWRHWPSNEEVNVQNAGDKSYEPGEFELFTKHHLVEMAVTFLTNRGWEEATTPTGVLELQKWFGGVKWRLSTSESNCIMRFEPK